MSILLGMTWVCPCCCDDVSDGYRDKGNPEVGGPKFRRLNCNTRRQLDRDPIDFGGFIAEIESLMPQFSPNKILSTGVTNMSRFVFHYYFLLRTCPQSAVNHERYLGCMLSTPYRFYFTVIVSFVHHSKLTITVK